jgi:hypothetical protein
MRQEKRRPRGLTVRQPWAWLLAAADRRLQQPHFKVTETRTWPCPCVGSWLLLHAGLREDAEAAWLLAMGAYPRLDVPLADVVVRLERARGAVVAVARVVSSQRLLPGIDTARAIHSAGLTDEQAWALSDCEVGPPLYGWRLADVRALDEPVPCRGAQGLWDPTDATLADVRAQLQQRRAG